MLSAALRAGSRRRSPAERRAECSDQPAYSQARGLSNDRNWRNPPIRRESSARGMAVHEPGGQHTSRCAHCLAAIGQDRPEHRRSRPGLGGACIEKIDAAKPNVRRDSSNIRPASSISLERPTLERHPRPGQCICDANRTYQPLRFR